MSTGPAIAVAIAFVWLGMVGAISFLEAPLKFRAPNVTLQIGLGIGRLVFQALNRVEMAFAGIVVLLSVVSPLPAGAVIAFVTAIAALAVQLIVVRPKLANRSDRVLAGEGGPRSRGHYAYVGCELIKVIALIASGVFLLAT